MVARLRRLALGMLASALIACPLNAQPPAPTEFTYQGQLRSGGVAVSGPADVSAALWDSQTGGRQLAGPISVPGVNIVDGLFTVRLDFGVPASGIGGRWLELSVSTSGGVAQETLSPRTLIGSSPGAAVAFAVPVYLGPGAQAFTPFEGAVRFNRALMDFQGYNGLFWTSLSGKSNPPYERFDTQNATDTFVVPQGVTRVYVEVWGAGGGGGGCVFVTPACPGRGTTSGGNGGAGGYAAGELAVVPGETLDIVVGDPGLIGANTNNILLAGFPGTAGGATAVLRGGLTLIGATGGEGGAGGIWTNTGSPCAIGGPNENIVLAGGEGGTGGGGSLVNLTGAATASYPPPQSCGGCCISGSGVLPPSATASYFGGVGLPNVYTFASGGGAGRGATGPSVGNCIAPVAASNGQRGEVRIYWTTTP